MDMLLKNKATDKENPTKIMTKNEVNEKQNLNYITRSLIAGGIAGCAAKTAVAPLDRVKILFQVSNPKVQKHSGSMRGIFGAMKDMYQLHGVRGLFQGHAATILRVFPYAAIKFMAFEQFKVVTSKLKCLDRSTTHFIAGSLAGVTSVFFTYPFDMLRTRMAYEVTNPLGILAISRQIYHEPVDTTTSSKILKRFGGTINFYRGFIPTVMGIVPYAGVSFWSHSVLSQITKNLFGDKAIDRVSEKSGKVNKERLKGWAELVCGGMAGAIAQTVSYPLEVVRRRMQVAGRDSTVNNSQPIMNRKGIADTFKSIYQQKGFRGFFVGLSIGYIKVTPMTAISFYTYAKMKRWLNID